MGAVFENWWGISLGGNTLHSEAISNPGAPCSDPADPSDSSMVVLGPTLLLANVVGPGIGGGGIDD